MSSGQTQSIPGICTKGSAPEVCSGHMPEPVWKQNSLLIHFIISRTPAIKASVRARARAWGTLCLNCFWNKPLETLTLQFQTEMSHSVPNTVPVGMRGVVSAPSQPERCAGRLPVGGQAGSQLHQRCPVLSLQAVWSQWALRGIPGSAAAKQSWTLAEQFGACSRRGGLSCLLPRAAASTTSVWKIKSN